jgi:hypothetical protein
MLCPDQAPSLVKPAITSCDNALGNSQSRYRPGMCWCDAACITAGDCCVTCAVCRANDAPRIVKRKAARVAAEAAEAAEVESAMDPLYQQLQAQIQAKTAGHYHHHDCDTPHNTLEFVAKVQRRTGGAASPMAAADIAAVQTTLEASEVQMQECQAADRGLPASPIQVPLYWTAGQVCDTNGCVGGKYPASLVWKQINSTNAVFAHVGIQFVWDGVIHKATAGDLYDIDVGFSRGDWICQQTRHGDALAVNVMTSPVHPG